MKERWIARGMNDGWPNGWMNRRTDEWTEEGWGCVDGWMDLSADLDKTCLGSGVDVSGGS